MTHEHEFNWELCQTRHVKLDEDMKQVKIQLGKVSNRFIILLTMLSMNLVGVAATFLVLWLKG